MFHNELEDTDDMETLEPINYEAEIKKLDEKLTQTFENFSRKCGKDMIDVSLSSDNVLETLRKKMTLLTEASEQAQDKAAHHSKRTDDLAKMKQELECLRGQTSSMIGSVEDMERTAAERGEKLAVWRTERASRSSVADQRRQTLLSELDKFRQTLGMDLLSSTHGGTLFIFTNIDRNNPEKKFSFELLIGLTLPVVHVVNVMVYFSRGQPVQSRGVQRGD